MARQHSRRGAGKAATPPGEPRATGSPAASPSVGAASAGEAERARLESELAAAKARIAELERRQTELANRIVWAIDTLHNVLDETE